MNSVCFVVSKNGYKRKQIKGKLNVDHSKQIPVFAVVHEFMNLNDRDRDDIQPIQEEQLREEIQEQEEIAQINAEQAALRNIRFLPLESNFKKDQFQTDSNFSKENSSSSQFGHMDSSNTYIDNFHRVKKMSIDSTSHKQKESEGSLSSRDYPSNQSYNRDQSQIYSISDYNQHKNANALVTPNKTQYQHSNRSSQPNLQYKRESSITHIDLNQVKRNMIERQESLSISDREYPGKREYNRDSSISHIEQVKNDHKKLTNDSKKMMNRSESELISNRNQHLSKDIKKGPSEAYIDSYSSINIEYPYEKEQNSRHQEPYHSNTFTSKKKVTINVQNNGQNHSEDSISNRQYNNNRYLNIRNTTGSHIQGNASKKIAIDANKMMDKTEVDSISNREYPSAKELSLRDTSISHIDVYAINKAHKNTKSWKNNLTSPKNKYSEEQKLRSELEKEKALRQSIQTEFKRLIKEKQFQKMKDLYNSQENIQGKEQSKKINYTGFSTEPRRKIRKPKTVYKEITQSDEQISEREINDPREVNHHANIYQEAYEEKGNVTDQNDEEEMQGDNMELYKNHLQNEKFFQNNLMEYLIELNTKIDDLQERLKKREKKSQKSQKSRYELFLEQKLSKRYEQQVQNSETMVAEVKNKGVDLKEHMHYIFTIFMLCLIMILVLKDRSKY